MSGCIVDDCGKPIRNKMRGYCTTHYQRWKDHGDAWYRSPRCPQEYSIQQKIEFFGWSVTESGCWEWAGRVNKDGYGIFKHHQANKYAHREMLNLHEPPTDATLCALHSCDNPPCVNPAHLRWGTQEQNILDAVTKGRHRTHRTLNWDQVTDIREKYASGTVTQADLAREYDMDNGTISRILQWKLYKYPYAT